LRVVDGDGNMTGREKIARYDQKTKESFEDLGNL
jgi:hypothetical protein